MRTALAVVLWASLGLIVYAHAGYPLLLNVLARLRGHRERPLPEASLPRVSLIIAAHDEEVVIERRIENAIALDYPPERLEVIVASDGSEDSTVQVAQAAGAAVAAGRVRVLDL